MAVFLDTIWGSSSRLLCQMFLYSQREIIYPSPTSLPIALPQVPRTKHQLRSVSAGIMGAKRTLQPSTSEESGAEQHLETLPDYMSVRGSYQIQPFQMYLTLVHSHRAHHRCKIAWNTFWKVLYFPFHNINSVKTGMASNHCVQHITQHSSSYVIGIKK